MHCNIAETWLYLRDCSISEETNFNGAKRLIKTVFFFVYRQFLLMEITRKVLTFGIRAYMPACQARKSYLNSLRLRVMDTDSHNYWRATLSDFCVLLWEFSATLLLKGKLVKNSSELTCDCILRVTWWMLCGITKLGSPTFHNSADVIPIVRQHQSVSWAEETTEKAPFQKQTGIYQKDESNLKQL